MCGSKNAIPDWNLSQRAFIMYIYADRDLWPDGSVRGGESSPSYPCQLMGLSRLDASVGH
jgi:hypothetical protein